MNAESILNLDPVRYLLIFYNPFNTSFLGSATLIIKYISLSMILVCLELVLVIRCFHLNIHRVKISRCCHYIIYVGNHLIQDFSHVIALFTSPYFLYKYNRQYNNLFPYLLRKFSLAGWPVFLHLK